MTTSISAPTATIDCISLYTACAAIGTVAAAPTLDYCCCCCCYCSYVYHSYYYCSNYQHDQEHEWVSLCYLREPNTPTSTTTITYATTASSTTIHHHKYDFENNHHYHHDHHLLNNNPITITTTAITLTERQSETPITVSPLSLLRRNKPDRSRQLKSRRPA